MQRYLFALAAIASLIVVAGCGSGSDSSSSSSTVSRTVYLKQGDALCKRTTLALSKNLEKAAAEYKQAHKELDRAGGIVMIKEATIPTVKGMTEELAALGLPSGEEAEGEEILAAFEKGVADAESDPAGLWPRAPSPKPANWRTLSASLSAASSRRRSPQPRLTLLCQ